MEFTVLNKPGIDLRLMTPYITNRRASARLVKQDIFVDLPLNLSSNWIPYIMDSCSKSEG